MVSGESRSNILKSRETYLGDFDLVIYPCLLSTSMATFICSADRSESLMGRGLFLTGHLRDLYLVNAAITYDIPHTDVIQI